jgi:L-fuculose-phosphate aldolase
MKQNYPSDEAARKSILEAGSRLYQRGLVAANDGNISVRVSEHHIWVTPTSVSKGFMQESGLIKLDLNGSILAGEGRPSSEVKMHLNIYREVPEILSVVHAHPPVATTFAASGVPLDEALLQETVVSLGVIPVAPFALPGTDALAEGVVPFLSEFHGLLLEHHGVLAWGDSMTQALHRMESIEYTATVSMYAKMMGLHRPMTNQQIDQLLPLRADWGITGGGRPGGRD